MQHRIDWFRILADLRNKGLTLYDVAEKTGIPRKTIEGYKNHDAEPRHCDGELLLALWEREMLPSVPVRDGFRRETAHGKA